MNIESFIGTFSNALGLLRQALEFLPKGSDKEAVQRKIVQAEKEFKLAEAEMARELGYSICKCTFPPQVCLSIGHEQGTEKFKCPKCGRVLPEDQGPFDLPNLGVA